MQGEIPQGYISKPMSPRKIAVSFPLRIPHSTKIQATEIAKREGLSLNQFIVIALVEKITRMTVGRTGGPASRLESGNEGQAPGPDQQIRR